MFSSAGFEYSKIQCGVIEKETNASDHFTEV